MTTPKIEPRDSAAEFEAMIAVAAYYKAEQRGFAPGLEMADWLEAERELTSVASATPKRKRKAVPKATQKKAASVKT